MNKLLVLLWICFLSVMIGCSKNEEDSEFDGIWKLESTSGGFSGQGLKTDWNKIKIDENVCTFFQEDSKLAVTNLSFTLTDICQSVKFTFKSEDAKVLDIRVDNIKCITISNNKLELSSECCDRYNYTLVKEEE